MTKRLLVQTQLSNINYKHNKFDLACDSGWQMVMGRVREMLKLNPELEVTVMCPLTGEESETNQCVEHPVDVCKELYEKYGHEGEDRLFFFEHNILPNALVTRFDFDWSGLACGLDLGMQKIGRVPKFDAVYINDPMHLRNFKAMFHVIGGYQPGFYVHSHFVDVPEVPKFPKECSLWLGQCEAALRADYNFWQCESAMLQFFDSMGKWFTQDVVDDVRAKSLPWDDGFSVSEVHEPVDMSKVRFTEEEWKARTQGKKVIFFPNRISPSSGDYTNGMKFMFELLPKLYAKRQDFVVVCGNPNQKFSNKELEEKCGRYGYVKLTEDTFNRDEYKFVGKNSTFALGLYNTDAYGGTAARELVELSCYPIWLDNYEYSGISRELGHWPFMVKTDFSNFVDQVNFAMEVLINGDARGASRLMRALQEINRKRCSYEATTPAAMRRMGLL